MTTNIEHTIQTINYYYTVSTLLQITAILLIVAAIVLWFLLDVPHAFSSFFRLHSKKALRQIHERSLSGRDITSRSLNRVKAVISWGNSSGDLSGNPTTVLPVNKTTIDSESTIVLPRTDFVMRKHLIQSGTEEEIA